MTLKETIAHVRQALAAAEAGCGTYAEDPHGWHRRHKEAMTELGEQLFLEVGAKVAPRWDVARVRIKGISSSSTSGVGQAFHNWLTAAEKKAGVL